MTDGHGAITTLLKMLREVKGGHGRVMLHAFHRLPDSPQTRDVIVAKTSGHGNNEPLGGPSRPAGTGGHEKPQGQWDGKLRIGEIVQFQGQSPFDGHVHLFNLGTSGSCTKLAPSQEYPDNFVHAGQKFRLPSGKLFDEASMLSHGGFRVTPPATAQTGHPERLLVIVTQDDTDLQLEDLHPKLVGRDLLTRCPARGPAFAGSVRTDVAKLFRIPPDRWDFGLLEMELLQ